MPDGADLPNMLAAALDYANSGIPVFPVRLIGKKKKPLTPNGFKNATTDRAIIISWWRQWPDAAIGAPTGAASGLVLLDVDIDPDEGIDGEASLCALIEREGPLPETILSASPRGGRHFYFQHPGRKIKNSASLLAPGIDIRGDGGFTVLPPSVRNDGKAYRWVRAPGDVRIAPLPDWLLNLIAPAERERKKQQQKQRQTTDRYADKALNDEVARVRSASIGSRNEALNTAAFNLGQLVGGGLIDRPEVERALRAAAADLAADDGADSVEKTIASGLDAGIKQPRQPKEKQRRKTAAPASSGDWYQETITGADGQILGILANALIGLRHDPAWQGVLAYDDMLRSAILRKPIPKHGPITRAEPFETRPLRDEDIAAAQEWLQIAGLPTVGKDTTHSAIVLVARENSFHPVRDYLDGLVWDGVERLSYWLQRCFGVEDTPYTQAIGTMYLISMIARIYEPGAKVDYMLILAGGQGIKKSMGCSILAGDWFSDNMPENLASKDASQHIRGKWLIELAELHALNRSATTALKSFLTRRVEIYRPSYGRNEVHEPRHCCFIGTTNKTVFLRDETGSRRFWPATVGEIDLDFLAKHRDQLFAEAVVRYRRGEQWWPTPEFEREHIQPRQEARYDADAWEDEINHYLSRLYPQKTTVLKVAVDALGIEKSRLGTAEQRRIAAALERAGWERKRSDGVRWWVPCASDGQCRSAARAASSSLT